ncbi:MAG: hypothetical protein EOL97_15090 [Spirochaetia bacterium]|nr:hypothetical protein [Spirochaetia bacterium]
MKILLKDYEALVNVLTDETIPLPKKVVREALDGLKVGIDGIVNSIDNDVTIQEEQEQIYNDMPNIIYIKINGQWKDYKKHSHSYYNTIYITYNGGIDIKTFTKSGLAESLKTSDVRVLINGD